MNSYPPYGSYFKAEVFPDMNTKLAANQDRFNRNLRQGKRHLAHFSSHPNVCFEPVDVLIRMIFDGIS